jgi:hypothetical protein
MPSFMLYQPFIAQEKENKPHYSKHNDKNKYLTNMT